ncbi:hypothetical protein EZJ19_06485 [Parasulfuritortus cantonensis]|uniref:Curli production assembly/transport component CsgG n=1 Tax=Parasulfuritortus cantonensis TaxID=2528202 RepID=A0A4R1BEN9_9PROT|nr:hypothetical protein [Parasulfuritortus cantonensis]TCJ15553.1 hypothetical protein EZJ19_06485 [Parasulfuritortus cantonensis]
MQRIAAVLFCLSLPLAGQAAEPLAYLDLRAAPETQLDTYVEVDGGARLKDVRRVVVPQFRIEFQVRAESSAADGGYLGGGNHASASNSVYVHLTGLDDALMQKITDQAYAAFVQDMTTRGVEVIGPDQLAGQAEYEPILRVGKGSGERLETKDSLSRFFAPSGGRVYALLRRTDKDRQGIGSGFATAFSDLQKEIPKAELALAKKYGAPCLKVLLTVSPARVRASAAAGGGLIGAAVSLMSSSEIKPGLTVTEESRLVFRSAEHSENDFKMFGGKRFFGKKVRDFTEEGDSAVYLKQDVRVADAISAKGMEDTTGGLSKVGNALAPVLALTLGVSSKHEEYTIEADPALFERVAGAELAAANRMLIARFRAVSDGIGVEPAGAPQSAAASAETGLPSF